MEKEKKKVGRKGAAYTLLKAFGTDLVSIGQPFYTSYVEAVKVMVKKIYGCEDRLIFGFDMPRGCDEKSIGILVTTSKVLEIRGKKEGGTYFLWGWPLPQQINFRNAKFFYECNPR
ncbi:hypothetical protein CTI12_AA488440 [Artemisia annua]|uniref:Uncharacterized protein n=1 Tax=Artemisia annua TaxID=35608 RepID=A0A2U1LGC8_ARTAN|nr:hypothetical protein CTI12_AA488440 [Artemisia annua]